MTQRSMNKRNRAQGRLSTFPRLLGGKLCLDFVNTLERRLSEHPEEFLTDYPALINWGFHVGLLEDAERKRLLEKAKSQPTRADEVYQQAVRLRETIYRVSLAVTNGHFPAKEDLEHLHQVYLEGLSHARLVNEGAGIQWRWVTSTELAGLNWAVGRSAVELLTSPDVERVKQCPGCGDCGWLFYDSSKGGQRQWCSMEGCGSRAKMRRHYQRQHAPSSE